MAIITGTSGNNTLIGTDQDDEISGLAGDDLLQGLGGLDVIRGGSGFDTVDYREKTVGISVALNGATDVTVFVGGVAEDTIGQIENVYGGSGNDTITGDDLANILLGGIGNDVLDGGGGNDTALYSDKTTSVVVTLTSSIAATVFVNGIAEDTIRNIENVTGGSGDDILTGDDRANILRGEIGNDTLDGGTGNDTLIGGAGSDTIDGGAGIDTIDMREKTASVVVTLGGANAATVFVGGVAEDTVRNVENIVGGSTGDILIGDDQANTLSGARGSDWLRGGGGADIIDGGEDGGDTADYSDKTTAVAVTLNGGNDATVTVGGVAEDIVLKIENLVGGSAADTLTGDAANNTFRGGAGADTLDGSTGIDTVDFSDKSVSVVLTLNGATDAVATIGGIAEDVVRNFENIIGGSGDDQLTGDAANNVLTGSGGFDTLDGGAGIDTADYSKFTSAISVTLNGANDGTVSVAGVVKDTIRNFETVLAGSGDDQLAGDNLANVFDGGAGNDTVDYSTSAMPIAVTLNGASNATVFVGGIAEDTVRNIENVTGSAASDAITGDAQANILVGNGGGDVIKGAGGSDVIDGGVGNDTVDYTDKAVAVILTLSGAADAIASVGGIAEDTVRNVENIFGGSAADILTGDGSNNALRGGGGADTLDGGGGVDTADYREKTQSVVVTLNGATDATVTVGGVAEDTVRNIENVVGGSAADTLTGDAAANLLSGNDASDFLKGGLGNDVLDGGNGLDSADYLEKTAGLSVTLNGTTNATVFVGGVAEDTIRGIENIFAGSGNDTLIGDAADNLFRGALGADVIDGGAGVDTADYREKTQSVVVTLNGATDATVTVGGVAEDTLRNVETILGGKAADTLTGDAAANLLSGADASDVLKGGLGNDVLDGGNGFDYADYRDKSASVSVTLNGAANATVTVGGVAEDTIRNIESLLGGTGDDTFFGDGAANLLSGGGGSDQLFGGAGADRFQFDFALGSTNVDTVTDFTSGDTLALARSVFTALSFGALPTAAFFAAAGATAAQDANQRIVYDTTSGALYYDADGNAAGATATQFATLATHPALAAGDFLIV